MELFSPQFFSALFAIILIDLALGGDNAIVIGLAARNLPKDMQKKVMFWGSVAAVVVRAVCTMFVVWLLKIPGFLLAGGLVLMFIAVKLVRPNDGGDASAHNIAADVSMRQAIQTIVIADVAMGVENILAIGGAAHGSMVLVVIGLLISVPIIMFGSQLVVKLVDRFPWIILLGGAVLAWTSAKMMATEPFLKDFFNANPFIRLLMIFACVAIVVVPALWRTAKPKGKRVMLLATFLIVWLGAFELIEVAVGQHDIFGKDWTVWEEIVDFVAMLGWIPVVIWLDKMLEQRLLTPELASKQA